MKKLSIAFAATGLIALSACGGGTTEGESANGADTVNVTTDYATDNLGATDTLGNQANALETDFGNAANAVDANATAVGNAAENATVNSQ